MFIRSCTWSQHYTFYLVRRSPLASRCRYMYFLCTTITWAYTNTYQSFRATQSPKDARKEFHVFRCGSLVGISKISADPDISELTPPPSLSRSLYIYACGRPRYIAVNLPASPFVILPHSPSMKIRSTFLSAAWKGATRRFLSAGWRGGGGGALKLAEISSSE